MKLGLDSKTRQNLVAYLLARGDDSLILGHRLSEWCGHAPILEEDIALANIALDCLGQAQAWLGLAGEIEDRGRSADDLAYLRDPIDFRNCLIVEQHNGDFARTMVRQFLFASSRVGLLERLQGCKHPEIAGIAAKAHKEVLYHLRHAEHWVLRLGDGTEESHRRSQKAVDELWRYTPELFQPGPEESDLVSGDLVPDRSEDEETWQAQVRSTLQEATLALPESAGQSRPGGAWGFHSEHLGHLLAEMQILARSHPGADW